MSAYSLTQFHEQGNSLSGSLDDALAAVRRIERDDFRVFDAIVRDPHDVPILLYLDGRWYAVAPKERG